MNTSGNEGGGGKLEATFWYLADNSRLDELDALTSGLLNDVGALEDGVDAAETAAHTLLQDVKAAQRRQGLLSDIEL
jgi:hypothetical protein